MVNFTTRIPDCASQVPAHLDFFLSSDTSISKIAFPLLRNSGHVVSVSVDLPINSKQDTLFHCIAYDYSCTNWDSLHVRWDDIFKLSAFTAASEFCEWIQIGIDVYISHHKYQVKPHSSSWFPTGCAPAIAHTNLFFHLYQQNKSSESNVKVKTG